MAHAATTGAIQGQVKDEAGKPMAGVTVTVSGPALQAEQTEFTDADGRYIITEIPVGEYVVRFYFSTVKVERAGVVVNADKTLAVNVTVPSKKSEVKTYRIKEKAPTVDVASTQVQTTVTDELVQNIAVGQGGFRTYESVMTLAPGAAADDVGVSYGGATGPENNFLLDGMNTTDAAFGLAGTSMTLEFIQETELITSGYNAEYGQATGGIVSVVTKSGSNEFHGAAYMYYTPFRLQPPRITFTGSSITTQANFKQGFDFGAEVGGPIVKDRIWFFAGFNPQVVTTTADRIIGARSAMNAKNGNGPYQGDITTDNSCPSYLADTALCSVQQNYVENDISSLTRSVDSTVYSYNVFAKLNFQLSENHSIWVEYFTNPQHSDGQIGGFASPRFDLLGTANYTTHDVIASYTGKFLERKLVVDVMASYHLQDSPPLNPEDARAYALSANIDLRTVPLTNFNNDGWGLDYQNSGCAQQAVANKRVFIPCQVTGYVDGGLGGYDQIEEHRIQAQASATYFARLLGTHAIKAGFNFQDNMYHHLRKFTGGAIFTTNTDNTVQREMYASVDKDGNVTLLPNGLDVTSSTLNEGIYARDSWNVGFLPGLTVNAGLRWELQQVRDVTGNTQISLTDNISPRVGLVYDFTRKGLSKIFASYGRFYESIPLDINDRQFSGEGLAIQTTSQGSDCGLKSATDPLQVKTWNDTCKSGLANGGPNDPVARSAVNGGTYGVVAPNIKGMYNDQYDVGIQYDVGLDLVLGASYEHRNLGRMIEDASPDGGQNYVIGNPGEPTDPDTVAALQSDIRGLDQQINGAMDPGKKASLISQKNAKVRQLQLYEGMAAFDKPVRDYNALMLTATKRLSHNFIVNASYTYSRTTGNYPGLYQASNGQLDPNISSQYDLKELLVNRYGPLPNDHPHNLKLYGAYILPLKSAGAITLGVSFNALSGVPIEVLGRHPIYGISETFILPRGSGGRTPTITQLNLRVQYSRQFGKWIRLDASWDIFNVLNEQTVEAVDNNYTFDNVLPISNGSYSDLAHMKSITGSAVHVNSNYGRPVAYQLPLSMRFGLRLSF